MKRKKKKTKSVEENINPVQKALNRFRPLLNEDEYARLLQELEKPLRQAIRVNPLKSDTAQSLRQWAERYGWQTEQVPYCDTGWWISGDELALSSPVEHRMGFYYIQDAASMLPVSLFDLKPDPEQLVLDMASSPGGKTTHLIDCTGDMGLVVANDSSRDRITALRLVLQSWGALNQAVTRFPGEHFGRWFPECFDRVLLDAPCSMQNLRSTESRPMRSITDRERDTLSTRQKRLLQSAFQALKVGGQVVYATCTLNPEEDEAVLDHLLKLYPDAVEIEDLSRALPHPAPGLLEAQLEDQQFNFDPQVRKAARFWPHVYETSGFFSALIRKTQPVESRPKALPNWSLEKINLFELQGRAEKDLLDYIYQFYGFDLEPVLERQNAAIYKRAEVYYILPQLWFRHFADFPFQSVGMRLGEETPFGLQISHEWAARFGSQFSEGIVTLDSPQIPAWLRGEDLPWQFSEEKKNQIVLVKDQMGRLYGRGRVQKDRLKNLFPRRLIYS